MGTIPVELEIRGEIGFDALFEAGEGESCSCRIETVGPSEEMTVGDIGPTVAVETSFEECFTG